MKEPRRGKQASFYLDNKRTKLLAELLRKMRERGEDISEAGVLRLAFDQLIERKLGQE
jgi:hypothetical protein